MLAGYDNYPGRAGSLVQARQPVARKEHRCMECGRIIAAGERYSNECWRFATGLAEYKMCVDCRSAARLMLSYGMGSLWDDLERAMRKDGVNTAMRRLHELTDTARRKVRGMLPEKEGR